MKSILPSRPPSIHLPLTIVTMISYIPTSKCLNGVMNDLKHKWQTAIFPTSGWQRPHFGGCCCFFVKFLSFSTKEEERGRPGSVPHLRVWWRERESSFTDGIMSPDGRWEGLLKADRWRTQASTYLDETLVYRVSRAVTCEAGRG